MPKYLFVTLPDGVVQFISPVYDTREEAQAAAGDLDPEEYGDVLAFVVKIDLDLNTVETVSEMLTAYNPALNAWETYWRGARTK